MKIQILSDIHLEMGVNPQLKNFEPVGDVLVLAGDICNTKSRNALDTVFRKVKVPIVYVMGNHEYYGGHIMNTLTNFKDWFEPKGRTELPVPKVDLLENTHVDIGDVRFIGATYWSNVGPLEELEVKRCIADFRVIQDCEPEDTRFKHYTSQHHIKLLAQEGRAAGKKIVVVTHFPPSWQAREERFKSSGLGSYFYNDDEDFVKLIDPAVWIYGHTHGNIRFKVGDVPVTCNQMGYTQGTFEKMHVEPCYKDFDLNYVFEI